MYTKSVEKVETVALQSPRKYIHRPVISRDSPYEQFTLGSSFASKWSIRVTRNCKRPHKDISLPAWTERRREKSYEREAGLKTFTLLTSHSGCWFVGRRQMEKKRIRKRNKGGREEKSDAASGPSWRKGEFSAISLSAMAAQRGARHQRRVKVIAAGCTSPILALRAANKPPRLFDTRNSMFLAILFARWRRNYRWKEEFRRWN